MKKIFRKAITLVGSAALIGATVSAAAAASYTDAFTSNTAVVYGANAAPEDQLGATNIASDLSSATAGSVEGSTSVEGGESYKLEKTSTKFNLGDSISEVVSTRVTDDNLPTLLADGKYTDSDNDEFDYTQQIDLNGSIQTEMFEDNDYKSDEPTVGIMIPNGKYILNYTLDFTDNPLFADLETTDLPLMGESYYVLSNGSEGKSLTLLDSAQDTILAEGESKNLGVGDSTYDVSINFISESKVILTINGENTNSLAEGQTQRLDDGSYVGVKDILYTSKDTGISKVEFSIGDGKLTLTDGNDVEFNEESISDLKTYIGYADASDKLESITLEWTADDDLFVTTDSEIEMPGFKDVKMSFGGLNYPTEEEIAVEADGDDSIVLENFALKDSTEDINILYFNGTNYTLVGKDSDEKLATSGDTNLTFDADEDTWFAVSWNDTRDSESYLMRANNFKNESGTNKTTIQYRSDGSWSDVKVDAQPGDDVTLGNVEFSIVTIDDDDKSISIGTESEGVSFNRIYSAEGMEVQLPWLNTTYTDQSGDADYQGLADDDAACAQYATDYSLSVGELGYNQIVQYDDDSTAEVTDYANATCTSYPATYALNLTEEDRNENLGSGNTITVTAGDNTNDEVSVTGVDMGTSGSFTEEGDTDVYRNFAYSELATEAKWDKGGDQYRLALTYHGEEVTSDVYVTSAEATVTSDKGETGVKTFSDDETSSYEGKNLIVVGGSAINDVAADLLGGAYREAEFTAETDVASGEFLIQSFDNDGKKALLVAGYNAADTTKAVDYLLNNDVDTTDGTKYVGSSATEASLVVA